jgi:hypothetical protein
MLEAYMTFEWGFVCWLTWSGDHWQSKGSNGSSVSGVVLLYTAAGTGICESFLGICESFLDGTAPMH